ncbi:MAG TPA: phenylalanine--tRNA ligase subunit beta, partial [Ignisphaera sp.]|nr:phenylalanine--tRNA ligase subunit beta [Ignisphaera sp.]
ARALRMYLGIEKPKRIHVVDYPFIVRVEPPRKRPYIAVAAVDNVELGEEGLEELIQFQEKLHITYGRNRRKVAIGLHDLDKLPSNELLYCEVDIDAVEFVPLHHRERMTIRQVLEETEQGRHYGSISINGNKHPVIFSGTHVISVPPVINAELTRIEPSSRRIFIDVTGTDLRSVLSTLSILVTNLSFYGGKVYGGVILYPDKTIKTPDLAWEAIDLDLTMASKWLGIPIDELMKVAPQALEKLGLVVESVNDARMRVLVPPYRVDVLHPIDVVEDIAIGIGYDELGLEYVSTVQPVQPSNRIVLERLLRDILVGLGYIEVNTFTLTPSQILDILGIRDYVRIENPLSNEINAVRNNLRASLLMVLRSSQHATLPVKIFEIGEVVVRDPSSYTGWRNETRVAFAYMDSVVKFELIHADLYAVFKTLGITPHFRKCSDPMLIDGRCSCVVVEDDVIAVFGEVSPEILEKLEIRYPVAVAEIYFEKLLRVLEESIRLGV